MLIQHKEDLNKLRQNMDIFCLARNKERKLNRSKMTQNLNVYKTSDFHEEKRASGKDQYDRSRSVLTTLYFKRTGTKGGS